MDKLTEQQRGRLKSFLASQGLTFKPLVDEMLDHMSCDLEERISQGQSFDEAWQLVITEIPGNHFQNIQQQTMETINKRFSLAQVSSYLTLALFFGSMILKIFHMQLAGELLLLSFGALAASLITASLSGIYINKQRKGAAYVLIAVGALILLLIGYAFKIMHFPGADQFIVVAIVLTILVLVINTLLGYKKADGGENLFTYLHEKYTPAIERFLMILLFPLVLYKVVTLIYSMEFAGFILLVVMFGAGLQFVLLSWRTTQKNLEKRNAVTLTAMLVSLLCFTLPFLGNIIPFEIRVVIIVLFTTVSAWLAWQMDERKEVLPAIVVILPPILFAGWALIILSIIPKALSPVFFNLPMMFVLIAGVFVCKKHGPMRTYMIISLASYTFEYISI